MKKILVPVNIISTFWFYALYGSFVFTWINYGNLPQYGRPDPKDILPLYTVISLIVNFSMFISIIAIPLNIINILYTIRDKGVLHFKPHTIFFVVITLFLICVLIWDPFKVVDWFAD